MFLNPLVFFTVLSSPAVSCASLSTFSAVRGSPGPAAAIASPLTEPLVEFGGEVERAAGEVDRVMGALTATESAMDVAVERDVCELVRRREAARRGRVEAIDGGGVLAPMRAASWLSEGRRPLEEGGRSDFESSGPGCEAVDGFVLMAGIVRGGGSSQG